MVMGSPRAQTAQGNGKNKQEMQSGAGVEGLFISRLSEVFELYNNVQVLFEKNYANEWPGCHAERLGLEPVGDRGPLSPLEDKVVTVSWASGVFPLTDPFDLLFAPCTATILLPLGCVPGSLFCSIAQPQARKGGGQGALDKYWKE